jgi:hypothetical protein
VAADDGWAIALPYGTTADWVRNVLAAGAATIVHEGHTHVVDRPELVPTSTVAHHFPRGEQRNLRVFGVDRCLRLRAMVEGCRAVRTPAGAHDRADDGPRDVGADVGPAAGERRA